MSSSVALTPEEAMEVMSLLKSYMMDMKLSTSTDHSAVVKDHVRSESKRAHDMWVRINKESRWYKDDSNVKGWIYR
ncbi:hypothetical protein D3C76_1582350 [compost metagenome]